MAVQAPNLQASTRETRSVPETAAILGISARSAWKYTRKGEIRTVRLGGRVLVPLSEIDRVLQRAPQTAKAGE